VYYLNLKTEKNVEEKGLHKFKNQAMLELIAACSISNQKVLVVLTDLVTGAMVYELRFNIECQSFSLSEYEANLDQMAVLVANYLSDAVVPDAKYVPRDDTDEKGQAACAWKRLKLSHDEDIGLETFDDFGRDLEPGSDERRQLASQIFYSRMLSRPITDYMHMYT